MVGPIAANQRTGALVFTFPILLKAVLPAPNLSNDCLLSCLVLIRFRIDLKKVVIEQLQSDVKIGPLLSVLL